MMFEEVIFFSFLCCVFGLNLISLPEIRFSSTATLTLECVGPSSSHDIKLYDHATDIFTIYHDISTCSSLHFQGEQLHLTEGRWLTSRTISFFLCPASHFLCYMFNPESPRKRSVHIDFRTNTNLNGIRLVCGSGTFFTFDTLYSGHTDSYVNFVFPATAQCTFLANYHEGKHSFRATISMRSVTDEKRIFPEEGNGLSVVAPTVSSEVAEGHRYIFKIAVPFTDILIYAVEACHKNSPNGECIDYQIYVRSIGNSDMISFPISKNSIKADAYLEINLWKFHISKNLNAFRYSEFTYRVNERILEEFRGKVFRKISKHAKVDVHVLECEDGNAFCDTEESRDVDLTVYGVTNPDEIKDFYIQGVKNDIGFTCTPVLSQCSVTVSMEKYRHTTLENRSQKLFLGLVMAGSNSYSGIFEDISITAVAKEET